MISFDGLLVLFIALRYLDMQDAGHLPPPHKAQGPATGRAPGDPGQARCSSGAPQSHRPPEATT